MLINSNVGQVKIVDLPLCPICNNSIKPSPVFGLLKSNSVLEVLMECSDNICRVSFIEYYTTNNNSVYYYLQNKNREHEISRIRFSLKY